MIFHLIGILLLTTALAAEILSYHQQIDDQMLYKSREWQLLLHVNGSQSEIDDPNFFIAPGGKSDPAAELHATLDALYDDTVHDDNATACRFPARTAWMRSQLHLEGLPDVTCNGYDTLVKKIDPRSVTLVFADAHINSPASMFGHTFLRIDSSYESKLLSHAINYAANADEKTENGVTFAIKGLFGGYPGIYSLLPYYEKLSEYKNTEQRDIWEYELNLNEAEVRRMVAHIWELHRSYSWYYFFDENCSYHMLWLLEVARPSVHLREHFWYQVIPPETVMAVEAEGLLQKRTFRPSKRSLLLAYEGILSAHERDLAKQLAMGVTAPSALSENGTSDTIRHQRILEAAAELCEYYYIENRLPRSEYLSTFQALLKARAALGHSEPMVVTPPVNPDQAHGSARLRYQLGVRDGDISHYLGIRASYHALGESDNGLLRGTQIEFFNLLLRYSDTPYHGELDTTTVELETLDIITLGSYAEQSSFFQPFSWRMRLGWNRESPDAYARFGATIGAGATWGGALGYFYLMADPFAYYDDAEALFGIAPALGGMLYEGRMLQTHFEYRYRFYHDGSRQHIGQIKELWQPLQNLGISLEYEYIGRSGNDEKRFKAGIDYYF